jgi:hypothetical protein
MSAWEAIDNGVVASNTRTREKYWAHWKAYTANFQQEPYLQSCTNNQSIIIITAFAARVRTGYYGNGRTVTVQTVRDALSAVSKTFELVGLQSPILQTQGSYKVPVGRLVEGFKRQDPLAVPQLAIPIKVPQECRRAGAASGCAKLEAVGDLALIAFYYLLQVGEYTKPKYVKTTTGTKRATRTEQFKIKDIGFFKDNKILPRHSPLHILQTADSCTLKITNQKNGRMGQTIHHSAIKDNLNCPIHAIARRVSHILHNGGTTDNYICDVKQKQSKHWYQITAPDMRTNIRKAVTTLKLHKSGIDPDLVGVHSLRAGGAMALKLTGSNDMTIMKMGRWTSLTFLQYIHNQIAHLSTDLAQNMSTELTFTNIAAIEK